MYAAGWYPDPHDSSGQTQRYYDGTNWTEHVAPVATVAAVAAPATVTAATGAPSTPGIPSQAAAAQNGYAAPGHADPHVMPQQEQTAAAATSNLPSMFGPRKTLLGVMGTFLAIRLVATFYRDGVGGVVAVLGIAAVALGVFLPLYLRKRKKNGGDLVAAKQADGSLTGALWFAYVQRTAPGGGLGAGFAAFKPSYYKQFASGLLAVFPDGIRFLPGPKAVKNGHAPWALPVAMIQAVEQKKAPVGAFLFIAPQGGEPMEFGCQGGHEGFADTAARIGIPVIR